MSKYTERTCGSRAPRSARALTSKDQLQAELQFPHIDPVAGGSDLAEGAGARNGNAGGGELVGVQQHARVAPNRVICGVESKTVVTPQSTNFYATNFELGSISPLFLHRFSRSRWRIDTEVFQTLTTDCHLKHPAVHQTTALVVLTMIRFLAYTLSLVFYQRQIRSHARGRCESFHQLAKRMAYWFVALSVDTS
jgi:hypothetical protein